MILCCGEALIDMIPTPSIEGRAGYVPHPGGAVFNTAVALGRLGTEVGLLTGLSRDLFGLQLEQALEASGVNRDLLIRSDGGSTLAFVNLVDGQATYTFFDAESAGRMLNPSDMPLLPGRVKALFFGGISLASEPCSEAYAHLLAQEREGRLVMLDPNVRPGFITDEAAYRARLERMICLADVVKVSDEDLSWLFPGAGPEGVKARGLLALGPSLVIVTRGSKGANVFSGADEEMQIAAHPAQVVDTVGAGDAFNAGFLAALAEKGLLRPLAQTDLSRDTLQQAMTLATRVAALTVSRKGANPPWRSELS